MYSIALSFVTSHPAYYTSSAHRLTSKYCLAGELANGFATFADLTESWRGQPMISGHVILFRGVILSRGLCPIGSEIMNYRADLVKH